MFRLILITREIENMKHIENYEKLRTIMNSVLQL